MCLVVAPIASRCVYLGTESLAAFHIFRGVEEGRDSSCGVLTGGPFLLGLLALVLAPLSNPPLPSHNAKLSLVPSQIVELVAASRPLIPNILTDVPPQPYAPQRAHTITT